MKSWTRWILVGVGAIAVALFLLGQYYVLNSAELNTEIKTEIPLETSKGQVVAFIQRRHPAVYDDMGTQVKARLQGLSENMVYRKDVVLTFDFSPEGKLLSFSTREYLTFL
jgi:hypothetical protein